MNDCYKITVKIKALAACLVIATDSDYRDYLNGVFIDKSGDIVSTDGKRITAVKNGAEGNVPENGILLPKFIVKEIVNNCKKLDSVILNFSICDEGQKSLMLEGTTEWRKCICKIVNYTDWKKHITKQIKQKQFVGAINPDYYLDWKKTAAAWSVNRSNGKTAYIEWNASFIDEIFIAHCKNEILHVILRMRLDAVDERIIQELIK